MGIRMDIYRCTMNRYGGVTRCQAGNLRQSFKEFSLAEALELLNSMFQVASDEGTKLMIDRLDDDSIAIAHERRFGEAWFWGEPAGHNAFWHEFAPGDARDAEQKFVEFVFAARVYAAAFPKRCSPRVERQFDTARARAGMR